MAAVIDMIINQSTLSALHARGREAWPDIDLDLVTFSDLAAPRLGDRLGDTVSAADLYLAIACIAGVETAITALDKRYLSGLAALLVRHGQDPATADDVVQTVRVRFLVGDADTAPRIASYDGRGSLASWIRVAAVRTAITAHRKYSRETPADEVDAVAAAPCPELGVLRRQLGAEFEIAFRAAFQALTPRDRNLLRYQVIDRLSIDRIAAVHGVHRATAARWVAQARAALVEGIRSTMQDRLRIGSAELDSLFRQLRSKRDLSQRLFLTPPPVPP